MIIYKTPGPHRAPRGMTYSYRGHVEGDPIPAGWYETLDAALAGDNIDAMDKEALKSHAETLGIAYDGRWGVERFRAAIREAM